MDLEKVQKEKDEVVSSLIDKLSNTTSIAEANNLAFLLADNFKDERIEKTLMNLVKSGKFIGYDGTLCYLLSEVFTDQNSLKDIVKIILERDNDGEILMNGISIIINFPPPIDLIVINKIIRYLKNQEKKNNSPNNKRVIMTLLEFYYGQKEVRRFYMAFKA